MDIGANDGLYSQLLADKGMYTLVVDIDEFAVDRAFKSQHDLIHSLQMNLVNPTPAIGWNNSERKSFWDRCNVDVIQALAIVHHLVITHDISFEEIGYYFMGKNMTSSKTKLVFTTPGSLKSKLTGGDPYLEEYNCVILDEIHERSVETDQLLLYMKEIMEKRPEFRLILMSATVDLNIFKNYFTKLSKFTYNELDIPGVLEFKVNILYEPKPIIDWKIGSVNKVEQILKTTPNGDILIFVK